MYFTWKQYGSVCSFRQKNSGLATLVSALSLRSLVRGWWSVMMVKFEQSSRKSLAFWRYQATTKASPSTAVRLRLPHRTGCHPPLQQKDAMADEQPQYCCRMSNPSLLQLVMAVMPSHPWCAGIWCLKPVDTSLVGVSPSSDFPEGLYRNSWKSFMIVAIARKGLQSHTTTSW